MLNFNKFEKPIHALKDLFLHLFVVTLGLLIALSLDNMVQSRRHRNQVHEADAAMHAEIESNAKMVKPTQRRIDQFDALLDDDLTTLIDMRTRSEHTGKTLKLMFAFSDFEDTAWKTAQTAGTFGYMPYDDVSDFSNIYGQQEMVSQAAQQIFNDMAAAESSSILNEKAKDLTPAEIENAIDRISMVKVRLDFLRNLLSNLDGMYKDYQTRHP